MPLILRSELIRRFRLFSWRPMRCYVAKRYIRTSLPLSTLAGWWWFRDINTIAVHCVSLKGFHKSSLQLKRFVPRREAEEEVESEDEPEEELEQLEDDGMPKDYKEMRVAVHSARVDSMVKAALGQQRSKAEEAVLSGKVMLNGNRVFKKSQELSRGDIVDLVLGPSPDNPDFTIVKRFMITHIEGTTKGKKAVDIRKWNNMVVADYSSAGKDEEDDN